MAQVLSSVARPCVASLQNASSTSFKRSQRNVSAAFLGQHIKLNGTSLARKHAVRGQIRSTLEQDKTAASPEKSASVSTLEEDSANDFSTFLERAMLLTAASLTPLLVNTEEALAVNKEFGPLEGRIAAFVHPVGMGSLFLFTLWAGYLGWQWRRVRTIGDEISALKKQIPAPVEGAPPSPLQAEVSKLTEERKELVKGGYRDRHFNAGSILLGLGVTISVGGCLNTWIQTGKLFPGPHLFAGAAITVLWALAAALVPAMQKGNESARNAHIVLNAVNVILFIWQVPTGLDIVGKILSLPWF